MTGFAAISELDAGDGKTTYICDAHQRYRLVCSLDLFNARGTGGNQYATRWGGWGRGIIPNICSHHQNDFSIRTGSEKNDCNVSLIVVGKVTRQCS